MHGTLGLRHKVMRRVRWRGRQLGIRGWLLLLVLWTLLPLLALGGAATWVVLRHDRGMVEARLHDRAEALAQALDRQVQLSLSALAALAASPALRQRPPDLAALRPQAEAMAAHLDAPVVMRGPGPDFRLWLDTRRPADAPPRAPDATAGTEALQEVFAGRRPVITPLLHFPPGQASAALALVPVIGRGDVDYALGSFLPAEHFSALLRRQLGGDGKDILATLTDSAGEVIVRSEAADRQLDLDLPIHLTGTQARSGTAVVPLTAAPGWTLWLAQPQSGPAAAWAGPALALGLAALLSLVLAAAGAFWLARRLTAPFGHLLPRALPDGAGAGTPRPALPGIAPSPVMELERLRLALDAAGQELRRRWQRAGEAAAVLRESEARFRALAENIPQLAWMTRPDGSVFWYNHRWYDYTGASAEEMLGWGWQKVHHPAHVGRVTARFRQHILDGAPWEDTFPLRRRDGTWRWFLSRAVPIRDRGGRVLMWSGTNTDITEQREAEAALATSEARLRLAIDSTGLAMLDVDLDSGAAVASPNLFATRGMPVPPGGHTTLGALRATLHPDDRDRVMAEIEEARRRGGPWRIVHRIRRADTEEVRWVEMISRVPDEAGSGRRMVSVQIDVTDRVQAEEQRLLLAREVDHRAKNVLAVVQALLALTPSASPEARRFASTISGRVAAMARAHALLARERWIGAELRTLVQEELAPYAAGRKTAVQLSGPELRLPADFAQPLSLVLHELATNAAKYGALSVPDGQVAITWRMLPDHRLDLRWEESGGPPLAGPPERAGFGSRLVGRTVKHQLHGQARFEWEATGLRCLIDLPLPAHAAEA